MKVNWATTSGHQGKVDSSSECFWILKKPFPLHKTSSKTVLLDFEEHFHIFVGDLATEIDQQTLKEAFQPFGEIS
jgi:hypothetical protein